MGIHICWTFKVLIVQGSNIANWLITSLTEQQTDGKQIQNELQASLFAELILSI